jgi:GT2 family glycosyltransferase
MTPPLTWSLVISTYQRPEILGLCVRLAVRQSRPPSEVVVVDCGSNWSVGAARVRAELAAAQFGGTLRYEAAVTRALTAQRNQGIAATSADIVFLLDDDSMLYEDGAERVMQVYERDDKEQIVGVGLVHVPDPPSAVRDVLPGDKRERGPRAAAQRWLTRMSWRGVGFFLPYDRVSPSPAIPPACAQLGAVAAPMLDGFRMTFRRSVCSTLRFEELLRYFATYGEDHDFCYRASRLGAVVELPSARLHHAVAPAGRLTKRNVMTMLWCNRVALQVANGAHRVRAMKRFLMLFPFHLVVAFLRDLLDFDTHVSRARGLLAALPTCCRLLAMGPHRVREHYPAIQMRLFGGALTADAGHGTA